MTTYILFVSFIVILVIVYAKGKSKVSTARKEAAKLTNENKQLNEELEDSKIKLSKLERFQNIQDVQDEIDRRQREFEEEAAKKNSELDILQKELKETDQKIRSSVREANGQKNEILSNATIEASKIIDDANIKAQEIAGDALTAMRDVHLYEDAVKAMKNIAKGYGDEYLIPNQSVIDELAEEYSFKEAGMELKKARERTRHMIKNNVASECDYVEQTRKEYAMHFVLDAFNGKVDSILSSAKHDNFGKMEQGIMDALNIVNYNGKAFRNARIRPEYFDARINELKWTVRVNEIRQQELEEQRQIKQAMREEERARREYEKAIRDAEKEEKMIQKALEKARLEIEEKTGEEKLLLEQKLRELEQQLIEAEEKNQRAISMAQQTKRGHVYVISNIGSFGEDVFKIGLTRRLQPLDRVKELGDASVPFEFDVHSMIFSEDAPNLEYTLHQQFKEQQMNKVNSRKEFFRVSLGSIREMVNTMGIEAKWTMKAEAKEYRESLAMAKELLSAEQ